MYAIRSYYATKYMAMFYYGYNTSIERNRFMSNGGTGYGIYMYYDNNYQPGQSRFVNNFVYLNTTGTGYYAFRPYYCYDLLVAHNTIINSSPYTSGYATYSYYGGNQRYFNNSYNFV